MFIVIMPSSATGTLFILWFGAKNVLGTGWNHWDGDVSAVVEYNTEGETAFAQSKTHDFLYVNYQEVAEVGVQHIVPFIKKLAEYVSGKAELALNPDKVIRKYITSRTDTPTGSADNLFDGDDSTSAIYKTPNKITTGTYIGVSYSKAIKINDIRFLLGAEKPFFLSEL